MCGPPVPRKYCCRRVEGPLSLEGGLSEGGWEALTWTEEFVDYEFEVNALGSIWELSLPKPYGEGGVPVLGCNIPGLRSRVEVKGTLNDPSDVDEGWSVQVAIPWAGLAQYNVGGGDAAGGGGCVEGEFFAGAVAA